MLPMTLMTPINITWNLQKHLLKIDMIIINLAYVTNNKTNRIELSKYVWSLVNENKWSLFFNKVAGFYCQEKQSYFKDFIQSQSFNDLSS